MKKNTHIILATRNQGKIRELGKLLEPFSLAVVGLDSFPDLEEVEETGTTFQENALLKAHAASKSTGLVAIADDSGLEVDYLRGEPGVYSARYSQSPDAPATDARNIEKLLREMEGVPQERRNARFRCCMAAAAPDGAYITADGKWEGRIAERTQGENGFGYDPVFFDPELNKMAAQLSPQEKNSRSHRGKAVAALLAIWPDFWAKALSSDQA